MLKAKDIAKLTKEEALKKREEMVKSLLELEALSPKKKAVKKSIARLNTYLHMIELKKPAVKKKEPKVEPKKAPPAHKGSGAARSKKKA